MGYIGSSTMDLLTHLYTAYAMITNTDWLTNSKRFRKAYAPTNPIKFVWRKIDNPVAYAKAVFALYSTKQVIDNAYQLIFNTGVFRMIVRSGTSGRRATKLPPISRYFYRRPPEVAPIAEKLDGFLLRSGTKHHRKPGQRVLPPRHGGCYCELGDVHGK